MKCESDLKNTMPDHLHFILGNSERVMKKNLRQIGGCQTSELCYSDTESSYFEKKYWDSVDKVKLVGENLWRS